ncbi:hypothetical protein RSOLAG22IIIB_01816 [Rhizoctonia solani]|uniref:PAS domain-containing protein n=1 Tax=Rhizoctonia solani TaxID=456999 RepID=A0A0K6G970_9AGAM|nr:hypothetical protein RSOLAG22IIIB_01816 [Rhizoctonia solani]
MVSFIFMLRPNTCKFVYVSGSVTDVLGFEEEQILQYRLEDLLEDEDQEPVSNALSAAFHGNKAAIVVYTQLIHSVQREFVLCRMTISIAGSVIVGSITQASLDNISDAPHDRTAEEVIIAAARFSDYSSIMGYIAQNWTGTRFARTVLLLDRFSQDALITHCTNNAILDNESCVEQYFFRYVAAQDEASVRSFVGSLRRPGVEANAPINVGFVYHTFTLCVAGRDHRASPRSTQPMTNGNNEVRVSAVASATSDGIIMVLKREH